MTPTLTIDATGEEGKARCRVLFECDGESLSLENLVASPFDDDDLRDARWYFEMFPSLRGDKVALRAATVESRLRMKGAELYAALFAQAPAEVRIADRLADEATLDALCVRIIERGDMPWIPWEMMAGPDLFPLSFRAASFVRVPSDGQATVPPQGKGLRVLLVTARPLAGEDVPFRSVSRPLVLAATAHPESGIAVDLLRPPTFAALAERLRSAQAAGRPYDLVHFDGHGEYRASPFPPYRKRGVLLFEREGGGPPEPIDGTRLGKLLMETGVRAALLNACRSAYAELNRGLAMDSLAEETAACGVPGVLAMGFNVMVGTAARLVSTVYAALGSGQSLGEAVAQARRDVTDRPGVHAGTWPGILDCALPVVYERTPLRLASPGRAARLPIDSTRATPASPAMGELGTPNPARSPDRPFVGYDDAILDLERAFRAGPVVELVGVAGAGKSALSAEFARWWALTGEAHAVVTDLTRYGSATALREALASWEGALWGLEGADQIAWIDDLIQLVHDRGAAPTLLTGRASLRLSGVTTVPILGLSDPDRRQLGDLWCPDLADKPGFAAFLDWSQGVPGVVKLAGKIVSREAFDSYEATHAALHRLRQGEGPLPSDFGLEPFAVSEVTDVPMPLTTYLFQGFLAWSDWETVAQSLALRGVDFGLSAPEDLAKSLWPAICHGFVCPVNERWYALHPLAPLVARDPFFGVVGSMGGSEAVRIVWATVLQAIQVSLRMGGVLPENAKGFASLRRQRQNLWTVVEAGADGGGLALLSLPVLPLLRDELLREGRDEEWVSVLQRSLDGVRRNPPPERAGPESLRILLDRLMGDEAQRVGAEEVARRMREDSLTAAMGEEVTLHPVGDDPSRSVLDLSRSRQISALLDQGEALIREGSPACREVLTEAYELAKGDALRQGRVEQALARAHLNVPALRDLAQYEAYARRAVASAPEIDPDQVVTAKYSLGNAIATRLAEEPRPPDFDARFREATVLLNFVVHSKVATPTLKASAMNASGSLRCAAEEYAEGASEMLRASATFEAAGASREANLTLANAARAFVLAGDWTQGRLYAAMALERGGLPSAYAELLTQIVETEG